jgi:hypothetical protein
MNHDDMIEDDRPWNAPWEKGHIPTPEERQEFADLWTHLFEELLKDQTPHGRKRLLAMSWSMVFSTDEFRDWIEAEAEEWGAKQEGARQAKNRRSRASRQRQTARTTTH